MEKSNFHAKSRIYFKYSEDSAACPDCPTVLFDHIKAVQVVRGRAFLFEPRPPSVRRTQDRSLMTDDPTVLIVSKIDAFECFGKSRADLFPISAAVFGAKYCSAAPDRKSKIVIAKINVKQRPCYVRPLDFPRLAAVDGCKYQPLVTDDPTRENCR